MLAVHVSTSVLRVLFLRVRSIQSILNCASTAVVAQVFVLQRLSTRDNQSIRNKNQRDCAIIDPVSINLPPAMKNILHFITKATIITLIAVVAYWIYTMIVR